MDHFRNIDCVPPTDGKRQENELIGWTLVDIGTPTYPITIAEVKEEMLITYDDKDDLIARKIIQVCGVFEDVLWISLHGRTVTVAIKNERGNKELPFGPVTSFIDLRDKEGAVQDAANYDLSFGDFPKLETKYDFAMLNYEVGYTDATIPQGLKDALIAEVIWRLTHVGDEAGDRNSIHVKEAYKYKRGSWLL